jgi:hypothetical protein
MTLHSARSVSLRAVALAVFIGSVFAPWIASAQSSQADRSNAQSVTAGPDYPFQPPPSDVPQSNPTPQFPAIPMPPDRAADSYKIYSLLMPVGELNRPSLPRKLWLLADTTIALVPPDQPCAAQDVDGASVNPHVAIQAPADRQTDFAELLEDFDRKCHERIQLTPEAFTLVVPLQLLTQDEEEVFIRDRFDPAAGIEADLMTAHYKGAPGLSRFSQVYFNAHHTVAMVFANGWCGGMCAQSYWEVLGFEDGAWKRLGWHTSVMMS